MAWEDRLTPDWFEELPFFVAAAIVFSAVFMLNPIVRWGSRERAPERIVPIEFVAALPPPMPAPAPPPRFAPAPSVVPDERPARREPGEDVPEKIKARPKPPPKPKPAAVLKPKAAPRPPPVARKPAPDPRVLAAARAAKEEAARRRAAEAAAAVDAARRAREAKRAAAAEAARRAAAERAAARAAAARAEADRRAAAARRKAELSQTLATVSDPDEALDAGAPAASASAKAGPARPADMAGARKAAAAAVLAETPASAAAGDAAGGGGADMIDAKTPGAAAGPDGSGVSWTMDGPIGSRRALKRAAPASPDWVGTRGLDLTVTVGFRVLPDGTVKPGAVIRKTSGFPEIDRRALDALSRWLFEPAADAPETWGRVTFRFTSA